MLRSKLTLSPQNLSVVGHQPVSRSASVGRNLGAFSLLFAFVALLFHIVGAAETPAFFAALIVVLCTATLGLLFSARALAIIWARGKSGLSDALLGLFYSLIIWAMPLMLLGLARMSPQVTDVMTEGEPPAYIRTDDVRPVWAKPVDLTQTLPEPLSQPLLTETSLIDVYELAKLVAKQMGWTQVAENPPIGKEPNYAAFQATATTLLGFTDDVVVQFNLSAKRTIVTMRSSSRIGPFDFGINAQRIDDFMLTLRQKLNER